MTPARATLLFRFRYGGTLVSLSHGQAVGDVSAIGTVPRRGPGAKIAYRALYQAHLRLLLGWSRTAAMSVAAALRRAGAPWAKLRWRQATCFQTG